MKKIDIQRLVCKDGSIGVASRYCSKYQKIYQLRKKIRTSRDVVKLVSNLSQVKPYKKGVYVDGHEREDVVKDRQERFLPEMEELMRESVGVREELDGSLTIINEDAKHIIVSVDQKAHHSNERPSW